MSLRKVFSRRLLISRLLLPAETQCSCRRNYSKQLIPMGKLQEVNEETEGYLPGQMFLHKVFPYRGVVLHCYLARVFERDNKDSHRNTRTVKSKSQLYYQVLVDEADSEYIGAETLSVTFLSPEYVNRNSMFSKPVEIPGVDYVAHQDMMPYKVTGDAQPIKHDLMDKFFSPITDTDNTINYVAKDGLKSFKETTHPWFCLSDVYKETTENICVTVIPFYMGNQETYGKYWWRYCIRMKNLGDETVTLRDRNWKIFCNNNSVETLHGRGVIGKEPTLTKESPAFQYNSHVCLDHSSGYMWGLFTFEREDGSTFNCKIPAFNLQTEVKTHDPNDGIIH